MGLVFDQVLLSRDEIYRVFTGFYWVLRGFTGFYRVIGLSGKMELVFWSSFTESWWNLPVFFCIIVVTGFYRVLLGFN